MHSFRASFALLAIFASYALSQPTPTKREPTVHRAAARADRDEPLSLHRIARPARQYSLGRLRSSEGRPEKRKPGLTPVGLSRALPPDITSSGEWSTTPEGRPIWRLSVRSEGASALRVRLTSFHVGIGRLWLLATDTEGVEVTAGPYIGDGPNGDGEFWTDMLMSDSLIVAYEPAETSSRDLPFVLTGLSHRFAPVTAPSAGKASNAAKAAAASCTVDTVCHPDYNEPASAVALMIFESEGESYQCSGALIGSSSQPVLPFFLTANHCISNADEAKSLIAFFNYQTTECKGVRPSLGRSPRVTGASFVAGGGMSLGDYTLLQLTAFPSIDVKLLGWTSEEIAANQQVTSISHPAGDAKRIALGERTRDVTVRFGDGSRMPANRGYQVSWFEGVTQGGSSGSPLLANIGGKPYVVGVLSGGPDIDEDDDVVVCRASNLIASYGRFTAAFPDLQPYLTAVDGGPRTNTAGGPTLTASRLSPTDTSGVVTISWQAAGYSRVQVRVGTPDGVAMTGAEPSSGSLQTGPWATEGMMFYLQDASDGNPAGAAKTLAYARVERAAGSQKAGIIVLNPVRNFVSPGQTTVSTTVLWRAVGVSRVQVRINSPSGTPLTGLEPPEGSGSTGNWVSEGTVFYLQDASDGDSAGSAKTLATVRAQVVAR
ncbi:MAG TPA: trypsin-like peptidase domain-containing protein [Bryobacteraceae bacterium]|nr:trypsin-like peptidase domain-containing protein [Bryobacteraceae bacterium]